MKRARAAWCVILGGCGAAAPAPSDVRSPAVVVPAPRAAEAPAVEIRYENYRVAGSTGEEIRAEINRLGPRSESGRGDARTNWKVRRFHTCVPTADGVRAADIRVEVEVVFELPEWEPPPGVPTGLVTRWEEYRAAVVQHENGHKDFGLRAGAEVLEALSKLPATPTCEEWERAAAETANAIVDRHHLADAEYDRATQFGKTQGVRFP